MGKPAAKQGDQVVGQDIHLVILPKPGPPQPMPFPFTGMLVQGLSPNVKIEGRAAATVGSVAVNTPPHIFPAGSFSKPPANQGKVQVGSGTVKINGKPAARVGDPVMTCNDPADLPNAKIVGGGTVSIGG